MVKVVTFLLILVLVIFIIQDSHLIVKRTVTDDFLGASREEYYFQWNNFLSYWKEIPQKIISVGEEVNLFFEVKKR